MGGPTSGEITATDPLAHTRDDPRLANLPQRFTIVRELGQGGMGLVVEAFDLVLGREVAIKVLGHRGDVHLAARFLREAQAVAKLKHPAIVQVFDIGVADQFIVMELVRGESLQARLEREQRLPPSEVRRIGSALLAALGHAHAAGIIHRDVKPANVLLGASGEVKLVDFGIARIEDSDLTSPGAAIGTPAYMAPEQLRGLDVDARADVYAVGATLFKAATGHRLHDASGTVDVVREVVEATGDRVLGAALARAVRERPSERFADGRAFAHALDEDTPPPDELPPTPVVVKLAAARPAPPPQRARWVVPIAVAALAGAGLAIGLALHRSPGPTQPPLPALRKVAMLPFADSTHEPELDFARSGLPHLLGQALRDTRAMTVVGYYQLESNVATPQAALDDWADAARKLGADVLVRGELAPAGERVRIDIVVETAAGARLDTFEREARVEQVAEVVRDLAPRVARAAAGHDVGGGPHVQTTFAADRALQLGVAALEREHISDAIEQLQTAVREAPDLAIAHYYLALALYWRARPFGPVRDESGKAIALGIAEPQRGVLEALGRLVDQDYVGGIAILRPLSEQFPDDKDTLYVLYEALYHGGFAADAMVVYRRLTTLEPRFRLALVHALEYYTAHGDEDGMIWALAHSDPGGDSYDPVWEPRVLVARRDYDGAIRLLAGSIERTSDSMFARNMQSELVTVYALADKLDLASASARELADGDPSGTSLLQLALATARDDAPERTRLRELAIRHALTQPPGSLQINEWMRVIAAERPVATHAEAGELAAALKSALTPEFSHTLSLTVCDALLSELADPDHLRDLASSPYPEARELAAAAIARPTDRAAAATAMRRAIASSVDGKFMIDEAWLLASDLRALGDHAGVRTACDEVIRPRRWTLAWGSAIRDCLAWTAEASEALGDGAAAAEARRRLDVLSGRTPTGHPGHPGQP